MKKHEYIEILESFEVEDFLEVIKYKFSNMTKQQVKDIDFCFWFCYLVEKDLTEVLTMASKFVRASKGVMSKQLNDFIKENYKNINLEKVDPYNENFDPKKITFGDRIYFVEMLRGKTPHTKLLWKIKNLRDAVSHGRWEDLKYLGEHLSDIRVKRKIFIDYVSACSNIKDEDEKGFIGSLTKGQKIRIDKEFNKIINNGRSK